MEKYKADTEALRQEIAELKRIEAAGKPLIAATPPPTDLTPLTELLTLIKGWVDSGRADAVRLSEEANDQAGWLNYARASTLAQSAAIASASAEGLALAAVEIRNTIRKLGVEGGAA